MCTVVLVLGHQPRRVETQRDLKRFAKILPANWVFEDGSAEFEPDACLCGIDVEATLESAGFSVESSFDDNADLIAERYDEE